MNQNSSKLNEELRVKEGYNTEKEAEEARKKFKAVGEWDRKYNVHLHKHMVRWAVYPTNVTPVTGNQCGYLAPATYGGLTYRILDDITGYPDVFSIQTDSFGKVNIYIPKDWDSCWTRITDSKCPGGYVAHHPYAYIDIDG